MPWGNFRRRRVVAGEHSRRFLWPLVGIERSRSMMKIWDVNMKEWEKQVANMEFQ